MPAACRCGVPRLPANVWMRAVPVAAGASVVSLRFHSRFLAGGAALSLVTLMATLVLLAMRRRALSR